MTKRTNLNDVMAAINALAEAQAKDHEILMGLVEVQTSKKSVSTSKTSSKKKSTPTASPKQTREERLTEKFGDKATRTKFVELRKKVAEEFKSLADANEVFIPKKQYRKVLTSTTALLNGKFNKAVIKKEFLKAAR